MTLSQAVLSFLNIFDENLEQPLGSGQPTCKLYVAEQVGFASFERLWKLGSRAGSILTLRAHACTVLMKIV